MRIRRGPRADTTILGAATLLALAMGSGTAVTEFEIAHPPATTASGTGHDYAGVWMSADDAVRLDLSGDGTYARSVVGRKQVALGTYRVDGARLQLRDSDGLHTTVTSFDDALEMAGYRLFRV